MRRLRIGEEKKKEGRYKKPHYENIMACPIPQSAITTGTLKSNNETANEIDG